MSIKFKCPICKYKHTAPDEFAGKKAKCPNCKNLVEIPLESATKRKGPIHHSNKYKNNSLDVIKTTLKQSSTDVSKGNNLYCNFLPENIDTEKDYCGIGKTEKTTPSENEKTTSEKTNAIYANLLLATIFAICISLCAIVGHTNGYEWVYFWFFAFIMFIICLLMAICLKNYTGIYMSIMLFVFLVINYLSFTDGIIELLKRQTTLSLFFSISVVFCIIYYNAKLGIIRANTYFTEKAVETIFPIFIMSIIGFAIISAVFSCFSSVDTVIYVKSGCSLVVCKPANPNLVQQKVTLLGLKTPNEGCPFYKKSITILRKLTKNKKIKTVYEYDDPSYNNSVLIFDNNICINIEIVRQGMSPWVTGDNWWPRFGGNGDISYLQPTNKYGDYSKKNNFYLAESDAKKAKRGIWSIPSSKWKAMLKDKRDQVRAYSTFMLGYMDDISVVPILIHMLKDQDQDVRSNAVKSLKLITGEEDYGASDTDFWWEWWNENK